MPHLGVAEIAIIAVVLAALPLEVAYWVIRLAVRSGVSDALRANREWPERHDDGRESART